MPKVGTPQCSVFALQTGHRRHQLDATHHIVNPVIKLQPESHHPSPTSTLTHPLGFKQHAHVLNFIWLWILPLCRRLECKHNSSALSCTCATGMCHNMKPKDAYQISTLPRNLIENISYPRMVRQQHQSSWRPFSKDIFLESIRCFLDLLGVLPNETCPMHGMENNSFHNQDIKNKVIFLCFF